VYGAVEEGISLQFAYFPSIERLIERADIIVQVVVLEERTELINVWEGTGDAPAERDPYDVFTIYTIQIIEVFKGNVVSGDIIEIMRIGGQFGDRILVNHSAVPLFVGEELVLFLVVQSNLLPVASVPTQSIYRLDENGEPISYPGNELILTREILTQIRDGDTTNGQDNQYIASSENNDNNARESNFIWKLAIIIAVLAVGIFVILLIHRRNKRLKENN